MSLIETKKEKSMLSTTCAGIARTLSCPSAVPENANLFVAGNSALRQTYLAFLMSYNMLRYHGWLYDKSGKLKKAAGLDLSEDLKAGLSLFPIKVEHWKYVQNT